MKLIVFKIEVGLQVNDEIKDFVDDTGNPNVNWTWKVSKEASTFVYAAVNYDKYTQIEFDTNKLKEVRQGIRNFVTKLLVSGGIKTPFLDPNPYVCIDDCWDEDSDKVEPYWFYYDIEI